MTSIIKVFISCIKTDVIILAFHHGFPCSRHIIPSSRRGSPSSPFDMSCDVLIAIAYARSGLNNAVDRVNSDCVNLRLGKRRDVVLNEICVGLV